MLTIGSALSKGWRSGSEAFRAGHYKDLTETGNCARKVSATQGTRLAAKNESQALDEKTAGTYELWFITLEFAKKNGDNAVLLGSNKRPFLAVTLQTFMHKRLVLQ